MLQIDNVRQIGQVTAYGDSDRFNVFYLLPSQVRYRRNPDGSVAFEFIKYRSAVDRPGGILAGGFVLFDVEFVVDQSLMPDIMQRLTDEVTQEANRRGISPAPAVVIGSITYTKGTTDLLVPSSDGTFVKHLHNPGKPSLYGNNVATFALELTQEGATFFEQAMQGHGSSVAVVYDLWFWAKLPKIVVDGHWNASKFYSFYQTIDIEWNLWSEDDYRETVRESMISSESEDINFEWGAVTDEKVKGSIRDWAYKTLEGMVERNMIDAIAPVPDDQRKAPDGIENVTRDITSTKISSVSLHYSESPTIEFNVAPPGTLENITELTDASGAKLKWSDYSRIIDLDDPFFKELRVNAYVNADFEHLPIHSVEVKVLYNGRPMPNLAEGPEGEVVLSKPDDLGKFATFVENNNWKYTYSYQINYKGQSRIYQSPETETNEGNLTIGVDDVGILAIDFSANNLDWNDLDHALVTFKYADDGIDPPIEDQFQLNQANLTHHIERVIFQPMRKSYTYQVKYVMKGGREFNGPEISGRSPQVFINDVFGGTKTITLAGVGDFVNRIGNVFVQLDYTDAANGYSQTRNMALNNSTQSSVWTFPVINPDGGVVTYSATVAYKDGTVQDVPKTTAAGNNIILPPPTEAFLDVELRTELVDWTAVKLARVALSYVDLVGSVSVNKDFFFSPTKHDQTIWHVELKDKSRNQYTYTANFFMMDGMKKTIGPKQSNQPSLVLDPSES